MAYGFDGRFNVSKTVGWTQPSKDPTIPPIEMIQGWIAEADAADDSTSEGHAKVCAMACAMLIILRYSPSPTTDAEIATINLAFESYPALRDRAEVIPHGDPRRAA